MFFRAGFIGKKIVAAVSAAITEFLFTSDADTGFSNPSANTIAIITGGTTAWRITSAQELVGPTPGATSAGADRLIRGSPGGATSGNAGLFQIYGGDAVDGNGGQLEFVGGTGNGDFHQGGALSFNGGGAGTGSFNVGGSVFIGGGVNANSDGSAGDVTLSGGHAFAGANKGHVYMSASNGDRIIKYDSNKFHEILVNTASPTITAGGGTSPSIVGNDHVFVVTVGTGGVATSVEITFAHTFTTVPPVVIPISDTDLVSFKTVETTSKVTISATAPFTAGSKIKCLVRGYE